MKEHFSILRNTETAVRLVDHQHLISQFGAKLKSKCDGFSLVHNSSYQPWSIIHGAVDSLVLAKGSRWSIHVLTNGSWVTLTFESCKDKLINCTFLSILSGVITKKKTCFGMVQSLDLWPFGFQNLTSSVMKDGRRVMEITFKSNLFYLSC